MVKIPIHLTRLLNGFLFHQHTEIHHPNGMTVFDFILFSTEQKTKNTIHFNQEIASRTFKLFE